MWQPKPIPGKGLLKTPSAHLDFGLPLFFLLGLRVFWSFDQRSAICLFSWHLGHSGCLTLYRVRGCTSSFRHHCWFSGRISLGEPSSQIRAIGSPTFWSTPTSHCRRAGYGGSRSCEWWILSGIKGGSTADVCAVRRSTYLQSGIFVVFPYSRHSLVSSGIIGTQILWRLQSICRQLPRFAPHHKSSYHSGPQSYILSFVHLFLNLLWLLLFPMLSKHPKRLPAFYRRYLYHWHMRVVVFLCCRLCRLFVGLKSSVDDNVSLS
jgi:hypothetical protein